MLSRCIPCAQVDGSRLFHAIAETFADVIVCAPVAQLDRAPGYEPGGREFESLRARQFSQGTRTAARQERSSVEIRTPDRRPGEFDNLAVRGQVGRCRAAAAVPKGRGAQRRAISPGAPIFTRYENGSTAGAARRSKFELPTDNQASSTTWPSAAKLDAAAQRTAETNLAPSGESLPSSAAFRSAVGSAFCFQSIRARCLVARGGAPAMRPC